MISVDNVTVSFGGWDLFKGISFLVNPKERIGLVGRNGAGKTTLLKIIVGEQPPTTGVVSRTADVTIGYLPQQMKVADPPSLYDETARAFDELLALEAQIASLNAQITTRTDYESDSYEKLLHELSDHTDRYHMLGGDSREADIERTLLGLGFRRSDFDRPTREFSGGWRMRIELAKLLLRRPSVLLLDEPTNHLDIESIRWLEEYLKGYQGSLLLISHDRAFLDNVTTRTIELSLGQIYDYRVNYSRYVVLRRERREQQMAAYANQQRLIEKTEDFIERFRYKPTKSNQVQSRVKQLERLDRLEVDDEDVSALNIKFPPAPRSGQVAVEAKGLGKSFGAHKVFSGADITIERGEKVALVGRNGEGKTTFVRLVMGQTDPTEGSVRTGHNVNIGYFAQNQDDLMDGDFTVFDTLDKVAVGDIRSRLRDILGAFLFRGEDIDKKVKVLSGGERSRLAMARLMLEPYNLLVLDEPTNHMDMRSKDILKSALVRYDGTVIVVSHDREFLDGLVDKVYEFRDGRVREYLGGIYYFLEKRQLEELREVERKDPPTAAPSKQTSAAPAPASAKQAAAAPAKQSAGAPPAGAKFPAAVAPTAAASAPDAPKTGSKEEYLRRKENEKAVRKVASQIEAAEAEITRLEAEIAAWDARMSDPAAHGLDLSDPAHFQQYEQLKKSLASQMRRWEQLHYELDILNA